MSGCVANTTINRYILAELTAPNPSAEDVVPWSGMDVLRVVLETLHPICGGSVFHAFNDVLGAPSTPKPPETRAPVPQGARVAAAGKGGGGVQYQGPNGGHREPGCMCRTLRRRSSAQAGPCA